MRRLPFEDWSLTSLDDLNSQFGFDLNSTVRWTGGNPGAYATPCVAMFYIYDEYTTHVTSDVVACQCLLTRCFLRSEQRRRSQLERLDVDSSQLLVDRGVVDDIDVTVY